MDDPFKSRRPGSFGQRPAEILSGDSGLAGLCRRVAELKRAKSLLWPHLPSELKPHCELANLRGNTLVFVARSPVWAAKLRQTSPEILHAATRVCKMAVDRIQVRIDPGVFPDVAPKREKPLSKRSAEHLRRTADSLGDETLATALRNIAGRRGDKES